MKSFLMLTVILFSSLVMAQGRLSNKDFATLTQLQAISASATSANLLNDTKLYSTQFNKTYAQALTDGNILSTASTISLTTGVSGVLPLANGGTNRSLTASAGAVMYMDGTSINKSAPGTSGQMLVSSGTAAPVFVDIYATQAIPASNIDWSQATAFTKTLAANTAFTFSNVASGGIGKNIIVRLTNTASNYTVTWPTSATVRWTGGTAPTMTTGATSDIYTFFYDGSFIYGSYVQDLR